MKAYMQIIYIAYITMYDRAIRSLAFPKQFKVHSNPVSMSYA